MTFSCFSPQRLVLLVLCGFGLASTPAFGSDVLKAIAAVPPEESGVAAPLTLAQAPGNIVEVAQGSDSFETLVAAVQAAGLTDTLANEGPFTVFAPTDAAFEALPPGTVDALLLPENRDLLTDVLTYHVVPDEVPSDELETGGLDTLNGGLAVRVDPDRVIVNNASVIQPDIPASNGVIHAINRVLLPPGLVDELQSRMDTETSEPIRGLW